MKRQLSGMPERSVPTPRARRIYDELLILTVEDALWLRDEIARLFGADPPAESAGVREPRRPRPPRPTSQVGLELPWRPDDDER